MRKIPTLFIRDEIDRRYVTDQVTPGCEWVLAGEGVPTRKVDGTCVMYDGSRWWARREVKAGKLPPADYQPIETDQVTGKTVGWEPIEQSSFARWFEAARPGYPLDHWPIDSPQPNATYELVGPKINGNPEKLEEHMLIRHGYRAATYDDALRTAGRSFEELRDWLLAHPAWEGIVWHHPDGRMAKLKVRDFPSGEGAVQAKPCPKCLGDKQIADSEDGEPWSAWASLPPGSDLAVRTGMVNPITCPECNGTGTKP